MHPRQSSPIIPASLLLHAYRAGVFPMADGREDPDVFWVEPRERAIFPLETFRPSRSLAKTVRQDSFAVSWDRDFSDIIAACAEPRAGGGGSWISHRIEASYVALRSAGHAHSIEVRDGEGMLVGGLYGVAFDSVFCGESMFSRATDASKVALVWLVAGLKAAGFRLLDCQFMTPHLASMGAVAMPQEEYRRRLEAARGETAQSLPDALAQLSQASVSPGKSIAQSFTKTS